MEVNEESSDKVKLAIKTNAWRNRAIISLDGAVKPSLRCISKSIKEVCNGNFSRIFYRSILTILFYILFSSHYWDVLKLHWSLLM